MLEKSLQKLKQCKSKMKDWLQIFWLKSVISQKSFEYEGIGQEKLKCSYLKSVQCFDFTQNPAKFVFFLKGNRQKALS